MFPIGLMKIEDFEYLKERGKMPTQQKEVSVSAWNKSLTILLLSICNLLVLLVTNFICCKNMNAYA